jgi:hypothetical protein
MLAAKDKVQLPSQSDARVIAQIKDGKHNGALGCTITLNKLDEFDGEETIFTQKVRHERNASKQMEQPFSRHVRSGEIDTWDIPLLMFLLCNSSHMLLSQHCSTDAEGLRLLAKLRALRNTDFGHTSSCSLSDSKLEQKIDVVMKFAESNLNQGDDLKERIKAVMSEQYSFDNTDVVDLQRRDKVLQD